MSIFGGPVCRDISKPVVLIPGGAGWKEHEAEVQSAGDLPSVDILDLGHLLQGDHRCYSYAVGIRSVSEDLLY